MRHTASIEWALFSISTGTRSPSSSARAKRATGSPPSAEHDLEVCRPDVRRGEELLVAGFLRERERPTSDRQGCRAPIRVPLPHLAPQQGGGSPPRVVACLVECLLDELQRAGPRARVALDRGDQLEQRVRACRARFQSRDHSLEDVP